MSDAVASRVVSYRLPTGKSYLAVVAKRAYRLRAGRRAEPIDEVVPIRAEPEWADSVNPGAGPRLVHDSDLAAAERPLTDVLLHGAAHAKKPVAELTVGLAIGPLRKVVRVTGDRRVTLGAGGAIGFTAPEPFTTLELVWDHAYGGRDARAEAPKPPRFPPDRREAIEIQLLYPRNYAGRGFFLDVDRERIEGVLLPNLDDPDDPSTPDRLLAKDALAWIDCPAAACFGPIDPLTFPRAVFVVPPDFAPPSRPVHEIVRGAITQADLADHKEWIKFDPRVYTAAPPGQSARLAGGERLAIQNAHPEHALLESELPGDVPRMTIEPPGVPRITLAPRLAAVDIEPEADRLVLTWAASIEVLLPYPDDMTRTMPHTVRWAR